MFTSVLLLFELVMLDIPKTVYFSSLFFCAKKSGKQVWVPVAALRLESLFQC
ncbi:MAG: hypothetical protein ACXW0Q_07190 [Methylovulum sp.]